VTLGGIGKSNLLVAEDEETAQCPKALDPKKGFTWKPPTLILGPGQEHHIEGRPLGICAR